jgi:hypothetical protein
MDDQRLVWNEDGSEHDEDLCHQGVGCNHGSAHRSLEVVCEYAI